MNLSNSVLEDIREGVGLLRESTDFDTDLKMHINAALTVLLQNGIILPKLISDETTKWSDLQDPLKLSANENFPMVPLYVAMSVKLIFDPPPPSTVETYNNQINQMLWRLKISYEDFSKGGETIEQE